jgi:hypothetical protein
MKHTPGPWQLLPRTEDLPAYVCKDANDKLNTEIAVIYRATDDCDANARLIAAAPELLAALEKFANLDTADLGRMSINAWRDDFIRSAPEYIGYCREARAAIAKATGA